MELYGRNNLEAIASVVPTRTVLQIRTHSQKYFTKINKGEVFPEEVKNVRVQSERRIYVAHEKGTDQNIWLVLD